MMRKEEIVSQPLDPVEARTKILVAEDSSTQAQQLRHILTKQGYEVALAANGRLALEMIPQFQPALIISDVIMPEMNGYQLSTAIKGDPALRHIPVILVTTMSDPEDVIRGLECGADNFVLKPYDEKYLLSRVRYVIVNREMRRPNDAGMGVEIYFNNERHFITADRLQILNLLLSTYDAAIQRNRELDRSQKELQGLNDMLKEKTAQLEAANRDMESFTFSVSHDLRAPLRALDGFARILKEEYEDSLGEEGARYVDVIASSSRKMSCLIDDLLEFSKLGRQPVNKQPVAMNALVAEVVAEMLRTPQEARPIIETGVLPDAEADPSLIRQVWVNLLSNAIKYSSRGPEPRIEISGRTRGRENVYSVRDNGAGFDPAQAAKLFVVFQRLHSAEEFPGTGVGLAIVQGVVSRHGGRVWAEGKVNEGATFTFTLPSR